MLTTVSCLIVRLVFALGLDLVSSWLVGGYACLYIYNGIIGCIFVDYILSVAIVP